MLNAWRRVVGEVYTFKASDQSLHSPHRLVTFTDGILAIAATVLVLDLSIELDTRGNDLVRQLHHQLPVLWSVFLGFIWIAGSWVLSHRQVRQLRGVDHYMSLFILASNLTLTLIPFATRMLAAGYGHRDFWVGVEAVSVVILVTTMISVYSARYALHRGLLVSQPAPRTKGQRHPIGLIIWYVIVALSVIAVVIAPFAPWVALAIVVLTRLSALLPLRSDRRGEPGDVDLAA